ncbi:Septum formation protein Maf [Salmonella enterica subsp. enterica]|nr:Septum formation protein Maf [Salmonella enterica subsp. enterica]
MKSNGVLRKARSSMLFGWRAKRRRLAWRWFPVICRWLGADTIVVLNGEVLEKPRDAAHAAEMLRLLSGNTHQVMTAVALADSQQTLDCLVVTEVTFRTLSAQDITGYVASGEPLDKAGAYGIQGRGGCFVRKINGSYHAVVGLPLVETYELLSHFNALP